MEQLDSLTIGYIAIAILIVVLVIINIITKRFGIEVRDRGSGTFDPVFEIVAQRLGLTQMGLKRDARKERVAHIVRLRSTITGSRFIRSIYYGEVSGVSTELIDVGKGSKSVVQETIVIFPAAFEKLSMWVTCTNQKYLYGERKIYSNHEPIYNSYSLHDFYKAKDPNNAIWGALSKEDISRLNQIADEYKVFEIIIYKGDFHFLMELTKMYKGKGFILDSKKYPQTIIEIVDLALELHGIFARAAKNIQSAKSW